MPWQEVSVVSLRTEFVTFAQREGANISELCRRFGISRKTGHKWLKRSKTHGMSALEDRSRRPRRMPLRTSKEVEDKVLRLRDVHPVWGARKLRRRLQDLGERALPAPSTITEILRRRGRLDPAESKQRLAWQRFEHPTPNALWQMDFKGHFPLHRGQCHPLTVLDDHSRFALGLEACGRQTGTAIQPRLAQIFERYGLPDSILTDNGAPWWGTKSGTVTQISIWLIRLGIRLTRCRPYHPQTQGKDERFHRTLKAELIAYRPWTSLAQCQREFDRWRTVYNFERPHEALKLEVPASRYRPSPRPFPGRLPAIEYGPDDHVCNVGWNGSFEYEGRSLQVSSALKGFPVAARPTTTDGFIEIYFCNQRVGAFHLDDSGAT